MARKLVVRISGGKGKVKENLGAKLATLRYGPLLRRPGVLGGPCIRGKENGYSNKVNIQSLRALSRTAAGEA